MKMKPIIYPLFAMMAMATAVIALVGCPTAIRQEATERMTVFSLQDWLADQELGPTNTPESPLRDAGASLTIVELDGGGRAINVVPTYGWGGLDINNVAAFRMGDEIEVAGRVITTQPGNQMLLNLDHVGWQPLNGWNPDVGAGNTFGNVFTLAPVDADRIRSSNPPAVRIRASTSPTMFQITELVVRGDRPLGWLPPWGPQGDQNSPWWEVLTSPYRYIRTRGGVTLTATMDGIEVSNRGTEEHDNNNGLAIDVLALRARALAANSAAPDIVIYGTVADGIEEVQAQGVGVNAIVYNNEFTMTIHYDAVVNMPPDHAWFASTIPFLGTPSGQFGDYKITGITVGGISILVLLGIVEDDDPPNGGVTYPPNGGVTDPDVDDIVLWRALIASDFIGSRNATLTATEDGIVVSDRGTGEHAHNHGIAIDIAGLRTLAGGTPAIVITGTATAGITRIDVQDMTGIQGNVTDDGTFTINIPFANVANPPDWAPDAVFPFLATAGQGEHGDYTITNITVGGIRIFNLPGLDLDIEEEENGPQNGATEEERIARWEAVIASVYIGYRNASLTATAYGVLVSDRGTGTYAHNHGIAIDIAGLRALAGGTPAIVIIGTATAGITRIDVQDMTGIQGNVTGDGTFTINVPFANAANPPDWALDAVFPFLATAGQGEHGDYTITGITVGGSPIWELLDLD